MYYFEIKNKICNQDIYIIIMYMFFANMKTKQET